MGSYHIQKTTDDYDIGDIYGNDFTTLIDFLDFDYDGKTFTSCYAGFYPKLFSIKIHHGGAFSELPGHTYEDGQVNLVDLLNVNNFSVVQLDEVRVKLGYQVNETSYYHLLVPGGDLDTVIYKTNDYMAIVPYNEVEELTSSKQLEGQQYKISQQMLNDFNPFLEIDIEFEDAVAEDIEEVDDHNKGVGSDETNSDYIVDMINDIDDVEVDIRNFKLHVDEQVEKKIELDVGNDINDEVLDNDNFESGCESNENIGSIKKRNLKSIKRENEKYFYIGQAFGGKNEVKQMIKTHSVESRRQLKIVKDDNYRVRVICAGEMLKFDINEDGELVQRVETEPTEIHKGSNNPLKYSCPWLLLISKDKESGSWMVKTFIEDHKCIQTCKISACISSFLSQQLMEQIEENSNIPVKAMQEQLKRKFEVEISKMKAFRAKGKALLQIQGDYSLQYMLLRDYIDELKRTNPGTTVIIEVETATEPKVETRRFKRIYICLGPLKEGFKAIGRDILGLDGSFMKGPYPGQILTAVGIDNNNGIYPLSYAIVEEENYDSWSWFIRCVGDDLNLSTDSNFTFVSDRQKGILQAISRLFPFAEHRFCLRHIHENMKKNFKGKLYKDMLWKLASCTTIRQAHSDVLLNNMCEVLNSKLMEGRDKPVITALEYIREHLMKRIVNVLQVIDKCDGPLTPTASKLFDSIKKISYKVYCGLEWGEHYQVYSFKIFPINGKSLWPKSVVPTILTPPTHHKPVGRPKKARKKSAVEIEDMTRGGRLSKKNTTVTCDKCRNKGHNRRICNGINQA
ncbi:hypothetical protein E3N88_32702 [Mikania micrantha]|uniref:Uncharacterized protein n=1 Tax=Mikania micrantha TaxID=192012 RepID=A0A5N6M9R5_9ASTR|nr:hypothetical protein E3N88_32702 [Mikania micrantha]